MNTLQILANLEASGLLHLYTLLWSKVGSTAHSPLGGASASPPPLHGPQSGPQRFVQGTKSSKVWSTFGTVEILESSLRVVNRLEFQSTSLEAKGFYRVANILSVLACPSHPCKANCIGLIRYCRRGHR